ncbi:hypothetical protein LR48_Vigan05g212700 [Vigna angularis]|uniref:Membrane transporter protein n=1 Tax=Phaseolus angularis TaxID=3914 RepID=A0A0L9UPM8_PHAAN|nr:hypothetical protein LR48_Vigan05g212700 [Vigna angularis]
MAVNGSKQVVGVIFTLFLLFVSPSLSLSVRQNPNETTNHTVVETTESPAFLSKVVNFLWSSAGSGYQHTWPDVEFGWRIVTGTIIGFLGSAFGTVGGVGGGMITGGAASTVFYNLKQKHPTLDMPVIDYDLALLFQPVLARTIKNSTFHHLFLLFRCRSFDEAYLCVYKTGIATKALLKGIETWKKETIIKKESARQSQLNGTERTEEVAYEPLPGGPTAPNGSNHTAPEKPNQKVPVALGVTSFQAIRLYKGKTVIASKGDKQTQWRPHQLVMYSACGVCAGMVGGLLGLGGGFILGPLFLELGIPPQVSSATATFAMTFSASMSVVEYYLLNRFPIPYTLYFVAVSTLAAFVGQVLVKRLVTLLGRASLIIFILSGTIFVSALSLGKSRYHFCSVGIANMINKIDHQEYMGFENLCTYAA